jgi:uncharacterized protein YbjT (DUF2867 family)
MSRTALIAGASGLVGGYCLRALLARPEYARVVALARRPLPVAHEKLSQAIADFDRLESFEMPRGADVFCALGTTIRKAGSQAAFRRVDYEYAKALAELAIACGAEQFVLVSSVGAEACSRNFYLRVKGETERAVSALPFRAVHILRPSLLIGEREESRPAERVGIALAPRLNFLLRGPWQKYRPIEAERVGCAMAAAALRSERGVCVYEYQMILWLSNRLELRH